jgi:hypothetical protein
LSGSYSTGGGGSVPASQVVGFSFFFGGIFWFGSRFG